MPHLHRDWAHPSHVCNMVRFRVLSFVTGLAAHRGGLGCVPMMRVGLRHAPCVLSVCCAGRSGSSGAPHTAKLRRSRAPHECAQRAPNGAVLLTS